MKKRYRIKKNEEFQQIIHKGKKVVAKAFIVYYDKSVMLMNDRVGISVSKKLGNAVERNKIKRQVRMMVNEITNFNHGLDIVIIVRNRFNDRSYQENKKELLKVYETVYNNDVDQPK
ncbi:MAG: ribonuclease P protein component [Erysipelotrichaceae bacterium]|nr:ribonuclease P protein component [Erysipelotrichaceae bacterium]